MKGTVVLQSTKAVRKATDAGLKAAVHRAKPLSRAGVLERMFTLAFSRLVYPQIWEDPVVDIEALELGPDDRVMTIASGGCNALSYLTADPAGSSPSISTARMSRSAGSSSARCKISPTTKGSSASSATPTPGPMSRAYEKLLRGQLDPVARAYWDKRGPSGRRRIGVFARNIYRHGLLGHFLGAGHMLARLHGARSRAILGAGRSRSNGRCSTSGSRRCSKSRSCAG